MKEEFEDAIADPDNPVMDVNANGGEVFMILLEREGRTPDPIDGSDENVIKYIHGMKEFLEGEEGAVLSKDDPYLSVMETSSSSVYRITKDERPVESMPNQADDVMHGVRAGVEDGDYDPILEVYHNIMDNQVRRDILNQLLGVIPNLDADRIEVTDRGWEIDQYYIVDWTASLYVATDDPEEDDYIRSGSDVRTLEKDHEFVELHNVDAPEAQELTIDGEEVRLGEREMLFLSKARWLMNRAEYHADEPFWRFMENERKRYIRGNHE